MSDLIVFDEFDPWEAFEECIGRVGDRDYCKKAVMLLTEAQLRQVFAYGGRVRLYTILPPKTYERLAIYVDRKHRRVFGIFLDGKTYIISLFYERRNGDFQLKVVDLATREIRAMKNPHPSAFKQHL
jgi:hypothetical protein